MQIDEFSLKSVKIPLHGSIVIWTTGSTHTLSHSMILAKLNKVFRSKLASAVRMQYQAGFATGAFQGSAQRINREFSIDLTTAFTGNNASVVQVDDGAVVTSEMLAEVYVCEIYTPFLIASGRSEILIYQIFKHTVCRRTFNIMVFGLSCNGFEAQFRVHVLVNCSRTELDSFVPEKLLHHTVPGSAVRFMVD